jgi:uncharacterized membrane protein YwaF
MTSAELKLPWDFNISHQAIRLPDVATAERPMLFAAIYCVEHAGCCMWSGVKLVGTTLTGQALLPSRKV